MKVTLKLYAQLGKFLPAGTAANEAEVSVEPQTPLTVLLEHYHVPPEMCHLVLVNGVYVEPSARGTHMLEDGDHLAVWPPVAGG
ncbi:MoaD/ThiS family protein [Terasakiella sp. SH-1]|uniref:MoaD/ThiS family protein n=1 Tax=Terasakiella sp. SH-1 TaxID=2560057 RepID=UPI001073AB53|nr:MoaD/ThiS family protein [Terasakiella sp. SH-1]